MRILHTADWHIGKIVNGVHMTGDQGYILNKLIEVIEEEKVDVVIIAGDLYDRGIPPVEAVELLDKVFCEILLKLKVPIITIAGNHDSADRLNFANKILKDKGLFIDGKLKGNIEKVVLKDDYGIVNFYMIPYADPAEVREILKNTEIKTHDDAMKEILNGIELNKNERNVAVAHGYITGVEALEECDSERALSIGGTDYVNVDYFKKFNYVALGHLHGQQKVETDYVRYSGSILKYSFSEIKHRKSVTIVDIDDKGAVNITLKTLEPLRDMRKIKGDLSVLLDQKVYEGTCVEDYIHVTLTDEGELIDPMNKLKEVYPNVLALERERKNKGDELALTSAGEGVKKKTKLELFKDFYTNIIGSEFTSEKEAVVIEVIEEVENLERRE